MSGPGGKLGRALDQFRAQQLQASAQLERKEPKKPKKEATAAPAKAAIPAAAEPVAAPRPGPSIAYLLKQAVKALQVAARPLTKEELLEACGPDDARWILADVLDELKQQEKIHFEDDRYSYKAKVVATNKAELLSILAKRPEGTLLKDIKDAYPGDAEGKRICADVAALVEEGAIYQLAVSENKEPVLYPRDSRYDVALDDRIKRMWTMMEVPSDPATLVSELRRAKINPCPRTATREVRKETKEDRKKKRKRDFSKIHVTNVHLWDELFANKDLPTADAMD